MKNKEQEHNLFKKKLNQKGKTEEEIKKGCGNDYCGKFIYHKDKTQEDTLCPECKAELRGFQEGKQSLLAQWKSDIADAYDSAKAQTLKEVENEIGKYFAKIVVLKHIPKVVKKWIVCFESELKQQIKKLGEK